MNSAVRYLVQWGAVVVTCAAFCHCHPQSRRAVPVSADPAPRLAIAPGRNNYAGTIKEINPGGETEVTFRARVVSSDWIDYIDILNASKRGGGVDRPLHVPDHCTGSPVRAHC